MDFQGGGGGAPTFNFRIGSSGLWEFRRVEFDEGVLPYSYRFVTPEAREVWRVVRQYEQNQDEVRVLSCSIFFQEGSLEGGKGPFFIVLKGNQEGIKMDIAHR